MIGVGDHFELWDRTLFEATRTSVNAGPRDMPPGFETFSL